MIYNKVLKKLKIHIEKARLRFFRSLNKNVTKFPNLKGKIKYFLKKFLEEIYLLGIIFWELFIIISLIILIKDPCKNCIVKACCTDKCKERIYLENFVLKGETIFNQKFLAWFLAIYCLAILIFLTYAICKVL